jgi:hypothetical protein
MNLLGRKMGEEVFCIGVENSMNLLKGMVSTQRLFVPIMVGLALSLPVPVQAALIDRGLFDADGVPGGPTVRLIYDDDLNITWLGDANFGAGSAFDDVTQFGGTTTDGAMSWQSAVDWADSLTVGGFTDWRLPTTTQPDASCSIQNVGGETNQGVAYVFVRDIGGAWTQQARLMGFKGDALT